MISSDREAEILRLAKAEGILSPGTLGRMTGVHPDAARRVLSAAGLLAAVSEVTEAKPRPSLLDPYVPVVDDALRRFPNICASRIFEMLRSRGYQGVSQGHVRRFVRERRKPPEHEAFLRLSMLPGEQAQVDWAHFGTAEHIAKGRKLYAFVLTLAYSRMVFLRFFLGMRMREFLQGFADAFTSLNGVPRAVLIDNLKSGVTERVGPLVRFNESFLHLANHYAFDPRAAGIRRGNEKGRVERTIRYIRSNFFEGREYLSLADLNEQARLWCLEVATRRPWRDDRSLTVGDAFAREKERLLPLPEPYPCTERVCARVGKQPYVWFDGNEYSVPHTLVRQPVDIIASEQMVTIIGPSDPTPVAEHARSYGKHEVIEQPGHIESLREVKRAANRNAGLHRLTAAVPLAHDFIEALALRGENVGGAVGALLRELDVRGAGPLEAALAQVNASGSCTLRAVLFVLKQQPAAAAEPAMMSGRFADLTVTHHDTGTYDDVTGVKS